MKKSVWFNDKKLNYILMFIKYIVPFALTIGLAVRMDGHSHPLYAMINLLLIIFGSDVLLKKSRYFFPVNAILILLLDTELAVCFFGGSYVTLVMIQSLASVSDLAGKAAVFISTAIIVIVTALLPVAPIKLKPSVVNSKNLLILVLVLNVTAVSVCKHNYSLVKLLYDIVEQQMKINELSESTQMLIEGTGQSEYYRTGIDDYRSMDSKLAPKPNVVLIFTEGLSQNIIEDDRNIMPNVAELRSKSLCFDNYYNHTFATYRGLEGQLYSGYQVDDIDPNGLISIADIFEEQGYFTEFINTEPHNNQFSTYLETLGFDIVYADDTKNSGLGDTQSDKEAFNVLWDQITELEQKDHPFFLSIYTVGTHVSFDSTDEKYGDGSLNVVNRFYNVDHQIGQFLQAFDESSLTDNTILIFTTDHATYADSDFSKAFPEYGRPCTDVDRIPLTIYYKGIRPEVIDVGGRNSLCLAATILDYLDYSGENYFLGDSLFSKAKEQLCYEYIFFQPAYWKNTCQGGVQDLSEEEYASIIGGFHQYIAEMRQGRADNE